MCTLCLSLAVMTPETSLYNTFFLSILITVVSWQVYGDSFLIFIIVLLNNWLVFTFCLVSEIHMIKFFITPPQPYASCANSNDFHQIRQTVPSPAYTLCHLFNPLLICTVKKRKRCMCMCNTVTHTFECRHYLERGFSDSSQSVHFPLRMIKRDGSVLKMEQQAPSDWCGAR